MKISFARIVQIAYGILLILFGLNGFFSFLPIPEKQGFALQYINTLRQAGYIFPIVATIMTGAGILFVLNRWVAFGLLMQLPVSLNIFAFHFFQEWEGLAAACVLFSLNNFLIFKRFRQLKPLFAIEEDRDETIKMG